MDTFVDQKRYSPLKKIREGHVPVDMRLPIIQEYVGRLKRFRGMQVKSIGR